MALDEPKDNDNIFDIEGFKYIVNKDFMEKAKPIKIDFSMYGFKISAGVEFGGGCGGGCGSESSGCC